MSAMRNANKLLEILIKQDFQHSVNRHMFEIRVCANMCGKKAAAEQMSAERNSLSTKIIV